MELREIRAQVLFQAGSDQEELGEYLPHLRDYINDGYDRLMLAFRGVHVGMDQEYPPLEHDRSLPDLPAWAHSALADWATWMLYRSGSAQKQARGYAFRASFEAVEARLRAERDRGRYFVNIPN